MSERAKFIAKAFAANQVTRAPRASSGIGSVADGMDDRVHRELASRHRKKKKERERKLCKSIALFLFVDKIQKDEPRRRYILLLNLSFHRLKICLSNEAFPLAWNKSCKPRVDAPSRSRSTKMNKRPFQRAYSRTVTRLSFELDERVC